MPRESAPRFTRDTIPFLRKAARQKGVDWLDRAAIREEFERVVREPLRHLALRLGAHLRPRAPGYHFPHKGLGIIKRSAPSREEYGFAYKGWISFTIAKPTQSRFDSNPSVFFMMNSEDREGDEVLVAGGLYMPSSRQLKSVREKIAENPAPFEALFRDRKFASRFPGGFSDERKSTRVPRGFDPAHSHVEWLKLQGFFVWRSYRPKEYTSAGFAELLAKDAEQLLRLNELLERAISGRWMSAPGAAPAKKTGKPRGLERVGDEGLDLPTPDF